MRLRLAMFLALALPASAAATSPPPCPLDCDGNGVLAPTERAQLPHALFTESASCEAADLNGDTALSAADLVRLAPALVAMADACLTPDVTWIERAPLPGGPRQEIGLAELDGVLFALGGFEGPFAGLSGRVETYDTTTDTWQVRASLPLPGHHVGAGTVAGHVYAIGGLTSLQFQPRDEVFRYRADIDAWEPVAPMPTARGALAVATVGERLHAIGGFGAGVEVDDHAAYDPAANEWEVLPPLPGARDHTAAAVIDGMIYVIGGRTPNTARLDRYDPQARRWTTLAPMPTARSGHAVAAIDGKLLVLGGEVDNRRPPNRVFLEAELYDPETNRWVSLPSMPLPRHGMGAAVVDDVVFLPGGATRAGFGATAAHDALVLAW